MWHVNIAHWNASVEIRLTVETGEHASTLNISCAEAGEIPIARHSPSFRTHFHFRSAMPRGVFPSERPGLECGGLENI